MSKLIVTLPNATQAVLTVADDTLVYDGVNFVKPEDAKYVMLFNLPVDALTLPFNGIAGAIRTYGYILASVIGLNPVPDVATDPEVVSAPDPSGGQCICFVTCKGSWISYVRVVNE